MPESAEQTGAESGANNTGSGDGAPDKSASVDPEAIKNAVAESLKAELSQQVTGAVKRQIASAFDGIDLDALRGKAAPDKSGDKGKDQKVNPLEVKVGELEKSLGDVQADAERYKQRAIRGAVSEAVSAAKVHEHARPLLIDQLSALAKEDDSGNLYVPGANDVPVPLADHLTTYLKDKAGLLASDARSGSGAGEQAGGWTEAMPKSKCDIMYRAEKDPYSDKTVVVQTPERRAAFIEAYGKEAWDKLPQGTQPVAPS